MRALFVSLAAVAGGIGHVAGAETFQFWPGDGANTAPGYISTEGHPCGETVIAKVVKLPTADDGPFLSEVVFEIDANGNVVGRWPMPVDYQPRAVRRGELLVADKSRGIWVRPDGSFRRATALPRAKDERRLECDLTREFGTSQYGMCQVFVDLATKKTRRLGFQAVCS